IRLGPSQPESYGLVRLRALVLQKSHLRSHPALEDDVRPPVTIKIGYCEGATIFGMIEPAHTREIEELITPPHMQHIRLAPVPAVLFAHKLVQGVPAVLVGG